VVGRSIVAHGLKLQARCVPSAKKTPVASAQLVHRARSLSFAWLSPPQFRIVEARVEAGWYSTHKERRQPVGEACNGMSALPSLHPRELNL
jgi:hypothetical protein